MKEQQQQRTRPAVNLYRERNLSPMMINNPVPAEWTQYVTQTNLGLEVIPGMLWDTATLASAAAGPLTFFTTQRASVDLSNMQTPGQLSNPQSFLVQSPRVYFKNRPQMADAGAAGPTSLASLADDIAQLSNQGVLRILIGEKRYGPFPLWTLASGTGPDVRWTQAGAEAANIIATYAQIGGPQYPFFPHLMIAPMQQFSATIEIPAALTLSVSLVVCLCFDGQLARAIQ